MEVPVFYRVGSKQEKISPRQRQACLKKITRLARQAARMEQEANALSQQCRRWGIMVPNFSVYALREWGRLLQGLKEAFATKNHPGKAV